jgi:hypothetical protein
MPQTAMPRPGRGGLLLHYTPNSTGPLKIDVDTTDFLYLPMSEPRSGPVGNCPGVRTDSISDCIAVAVVEWKQAGWGWCYFHHIAGGYCDLPLEREFKEFLGNVDNRNNCCSVVFASYETGTDSVLAQLKLFFPMRLCSLYLTQANSADVGVVFDKVGTFGETFAAGVRQRYGASGYCGPISSMIDSRMVTSRDDFDALNVPGPARRFRSLGDNPRAKEAPPRTDAGTQQYRGRRPPRIQPL